MNSTAPEPVIPGLPITKPPPPDPTAERCHLLGPTALVVQAIMGLVVISSLVLKRQLEKRKRPWRVWVLDVGKQLVGQGVIHFLNILISSVVADSSDNNPCSLYFLNILIDTTIGVAIFYFGLVAYTRIWTHKYGPDGFTSGQYGRPPQWQYWAKQLQPYLAAIVTMKLIVLLPLTLPGISNAIIRWGQSILAWLPVNVQVVFVLAVFPVIMNVFQFCVIDQVIKAGKGTEAKHEDEDQEMDDEGYRPLATREADAEQATPRRRSSNARDTPMARTTSRANSFAGSVPPSPRFPTRHEDPENEIALKRLPSSENVWGGSRRARSPWLPDDNEAEVLLDSPDAVSPPFSLAKHER